MARGAPFPSSELHNVSDYVPWQGFCRCLVRRFIDASAPGVGVTVNVAGQKAFVLSIGFEGLELSSRTPPGRRTCDRVLKVRLKDQARFVQMALKHLGLFRDQVGVEDRG